MEGTLREWIGAKVSVAITQPLLNLRIPPLLWRGLGAVTGHEPGPESRVSILCRHGRIEITALTPRIWRVVAHRGQKSEYRSQSVVCREREPLSVESEESGGLRVWSPGSEPTGLEASVEPAAARLTFFAGGRRLHTDAVPTGFRKRWVRCRKRAPEAEAYLGFGEKSGGLFKNGARLVMWNTDNPEMGTRSDPIYQSSPLQVALRGDGTSHALFFDNPHYSVFRLGGQGSAPETLYVAAGHPLVYYVLAGPTLPDLLEQLTRLTGRSPLPPRWMLGHHHSRWDPEESQEKALATAREFRRRHIPCDVIHLDIGHMEGYRCFTWSAGRFPEPKALVEALHRLGFRVMVIVDPGIKRDPSFPVYRDGKDRGLFCTDRRGRVHHAPVWPGPAAFPDFTSPRVRAWWGRLFGPYLQAGVDGFWLDMNEPSVFTAARTLTRRVRHDGAGHRSVHNLYGLLMARASYEGVRALAPEHRPYLFTRAAFT
jgi:alpha-glucosidase